MNFSDLRRIVATPAPFRGAKDMLDVSRLVRLAGLSTRDSFLYHSPLRPTSRHIAELCGAKVLSPEWYGATAPAPPDLVADLQVMPVRLALGAFAVQASELLAMPLELCTDNMTEETSRAAALFRAPHGWQLSFFDARGPSGHDEGDPWQMVAEAILQGYRYVNPGVVDALVALTLEGPRTTRENPARSSRGRPPPLRREVPEGPWHPVWAPIPTRPWYLRNAAGESYRSPGAEYPSRWRSGEEAARKAEKLNAPRRRTRPNPARSILPPGTFWHGTETEAAGLAILRDGRLLPGDTRYSGLSTPREGRVYVSSRPQYAAIYALGGDYLGHAPPPDRGRGRFGYVFEVEIDPGADMVIDEDKLGELAAEGEIRWLARFAAGVASQIDYEGDVEEREEHGEGGARSLWSAAKDGDYSAWIQLGHVLLDRLDDDQMAELLPHATQFAVDGQVLVVRAWRLDKTRSAEMSHYDGAATLAACELVYPARPGSARAG